MRDILACLKFEWIVVLAATVGTFASQAHGQTVRPSEVNVSRPAAARVVASSGNFAAFTWSHNQPPASSHVSGLVHIHPGTPLAEAAAKLRALPRGRRYVIIQNLTEDLASHPADQCLRRTWRLVTRAVPAPARGVSTSDIGVAPLMKAASSNRNAAVSKGRTTVTISERVAVDTPTGFRGPWMENGISVVSRRMENIFSQLRTLGAEIDCLAVDNETWLHAASFLGNDGALKAIEQDPRWPTLSTTLGLPRVISDMSWGSPKYFQWTEIMSGRFDAALNQAVFLPLRKHFPNASANQYMSCRVTAAVASPDINGHLDRRETRGFGTHDNSEFYGWTAAGRVAKAGGNATDPSWLAFRVEIHKIRGMIASSPRPKHAWIAARSWEGEWWGKVPYANSPLWDEAIIQLGMHGVRHFFELAIEDYSISPAENLAKRVSDRKWLEGDLAELEARLGTAAPTGHLVLSQPSWSDNVVATGQRIGNKCVWRFSFAPHVRAIRVQLSDGSSPVITREHGRCGAWFEHPADLSIRMASGSALPVLDLIADQPNSGVSLMP